MKKTIFHLLLYSLVLLTHLSCKKEQLNLVDPSKYLVTQISIHPNGNIDTTYISVFGPYYKRGSNDFRYELNQSSFNNIISISANNDFISYNNSLGEITKKITSIETTEKSIHVYYSAIDESNQNDSISGSMQFTYIP